MKSMVLDFCKIEEKDGYIVRRCEIRRLEDSIESDYKELWFKFPNTVTSPLDDDCDSYLLAVIMDAMREKRNILINGSVSKILLSNLVEYQGAWNKWLPEVYTIIDIDVLKVREDTLAFPGAIVAFSGGVDAHFSVWRHSQNRASFRSQKINICSMVHGFDIPLVKRESFNKTKNRAIKTLDDIDIGLISIETNYREITTVMWEHAHASALIATLSNFKKIAGTCIVGSAYHYGDLVIPWGSTPILDHLLGSGEFTVMHDGATYTRTEKVQLVSEWKTGRENLRVCWQSDLYDSNCGECEKCVRTQLNFLAVGKPIPQCFPQSKSIRTKVQGVTILHKGVYNEWKDIVEQAETHGIQDVWIKDAKVVMAKAVVILQKKDKTFFRKILKEVNRIKRHLKS